MKALRWLSAAMPLAVSLVLSLSPVTAPVAAAPPEPIQAATSDDSVIVPDSGTETDNSHTAKTLQLPESPVQLFADITVRDGANGGDGSVRLRGVEAPVVLEQREAQGADRRPEDGKTPDTPERVEWDPGDGPVRKRHQAAKERDQDRDRDRGEIRVWPMPAESYSFTQHFGCVPQLGNLYFPGAGCPANAPVIHTGIDLAAPEGTPFYATASGWVTLADYDRPTADANTRIIIQHDGRNEGYATDYLHWVASYVEEGDYVHAGDPIGEVGNVGFSTGPHLHFSVTDLDTGEFIDPLRWLPDEPGLEGYVSRMPSARLRLPAGTTAGQPESADPAPPPPAVKEDVPESPSGDGKRGERSERRGERKREERRGEARDDSAANDAKRSGKKRSRDDGAAETNADGSTSDAKHDRDRSRERERTRERNKDGSRSEDAASGGDGRNRERRADSSEGDRRENREADEDVDGGGKEQRKDERKDEGGGRAARDPEPVDSSGRDEGRGRDERGADRQEPDQREPDGGGHDGNRERDRKS
jgi:murein DD-endopeptidase MepM/ murein hydrolase activator NlpD